MKRSILAHYESQIAAGQLLPDPAQHAAVLLLDDLSKRLMSRAAAPKAGLIARLRRERPAPPVRGLYLHGSVGRGKSMLMDLFYETSGVAAKRRWHFHEFMAQVHDRIARGRATTDGDPIPFVAVEMAAEAPLLCFDELQVTDIADAMILGRLFKGLFERGVVIVATSNVPPDRLYWNGLNRQLFTPFIELILSHVDVFELKSARDFRLEKLGGLPLYFAPNDERARADFEGHWRRLTATSVPQPAVIEVKGRKVRVPLASSGVARFRFSDLCEQPLGALDYLKVAQSFHTVMIEDVPKLGPEKRNEARRFINLIDTLYDHQVCLIATAAAEPHLLYARGDGADAFERTVSRLMEMRSEAYLARRPADEAAAHGPFA
ncbi:MAG: cell division protein ZapE [Hyphomicrobium sp.]